MIVLKLACGAAFSPIAEMPKFSRLKPDGRGRIVVLDTGGSSQRPRLDGEPAPCLACPCSRRAGRTHERAFNAEGTLSPARHIVLCYAEAQRPPTEFHEGEWRHPSVDGAEPWAVVSYAHEPSPETGHIGWCWWALGRMGEADSYESACAAAVAEIQRRMDDEVLS